MSLDEKIALPPSYLPGAQMILRYAVLLITVLIMLTSCTGDSERHEEPLPAEPLPEYEYEVGLGYGFLGKAVQVRIDGHEVISVVGSEEIEQFAQLQGTKMLGSGASPTKEITVRVTIDGGEPYEKIIDLSDGRYVHIYQEATELQIYNTRFLVLE